ncbi:uncharacterized protein B0J16DRAFT_404785 [Fusarium flagelliforme]|uniref:uncharacterized protein n=1 Tax=Fusarium flagelliforme TaxID=2675880 RepID=UPI001E8D60A7|nr:uncharacterized protein B0J16DRAFT_404785 [Fusarium flagelliforme]KAH7174934.1 hypothetical protein B0J16DRAFT_404785 [Fusarium flagelliforme]
MHKMLGAGVARWDACTTLSHSKAQIQNLKETTQSLSNEVVSNPSNPAVAESVAPQIRYPNPGYLGSSSHTALFNHVRKGNGEPFTQGSEEGGQEISPRFDASIDKNLVVVGTQLLKELSCLPNILTYFDLVQNWVVKGANMGLVEPLTQPCSQNTRLVLSTLVGNPEMAPSVSQSLFAQSSLPMSANATTTIEDFCNGFDKPKARWETIALFFTAACRAATDIPYVVGVYDTHHDRQNIQATAMRFAEVPDQGN